MWNHVTLDGFFEGPKSWEIDWLQSAFDDELEELSRAQLVSADMLLFGRVTYQGMAAYWPTATGAIAELMNDIPKTVFSRTLDHVEWKNARLVTHDPADEVARLKQTPGKNIFIFGSADLCATLIGHRLIDEFRVCVHPLILGRGNPLFKANPDRTKLALVEAKPLRFGGVVLRYRPA
jgi:dihydrofolate reductase